LNYRKLKKKLLSIPWWAIPFVGFGIVDMNNQGPTPTNLLIIVVPIIIASIFWVHRIRTDVPKKSLKRERI